MALDASAADVNLWRDTAKETFETEPFIGEAEADLIIVGGGFTGCSAALHAAEAGAAVRLFEADAIAHGGSGRNAGLVNPGLWLPPSAIDAALGEKAGARLSAALASSPDLVFDLIERHSVACDAARNGTLLLAHSERGRATIENRHRELSASGAPVRLLSASETTERTGTPIHHGALFDERAGVINPAAYCRGLARAAVAAGAQLHEGSPVVSVAQEGDRWIVRTAAGAARAPTLLLATNAYHQGVDGLAAPSTSILHYFQIATAPLSDNLRGSILPGGEGCGDTATVMSSFRLDAAGRLVMGGVGALDHPGRGVHRAWAEREIARLFPHLGPQPVEFAWFGRIAATTDHIPKVVRLGAPDGPRGLSIFGYTGRGIAPGTAFGRAAATALLTGDEDALPLAPIDAYAESFKGLRQAYYELGATLTHFVKRG